MACCLAKGELRARFAICTYGWLSWQFVWVGDIVAGELDGARVKLR